MQIIFWLAVLGLFHSYIFFPFLMKILARGCSANAVFFEKNDPNLPEISILMSVFNEEKVILQKLESLAALDYPTEKLQIFIGSDSSDDATDAIIFDFKKRMPNLQFFDFKTRRGKPPVINELAETALKKNTAGPGHVFLLTDASVMLQPDTLFELAKHFKNPKIGVVDAQISGTGLRETGISRSENQYMTHEIALKIHESRAFGMMMGPFGGCFAVRSDLFAPIPPNSLVDDFWLTMQVLARGFSAISEPNACCTEGATHAVADEYRRKKRIAAGSFQNLARFKTWVLPPISRLGFVFFSHKVLRWFGGFLMFGAWAAAFFLMGKNWFYAASFWAMTAVFLGIPALDFSLKTLKTNWLPVRSLAYFILMNVALMDGFFKWARGVRTNIWVPTKRY